MAAIADRTVSVRLRADVTGFIAAMRAAERSLNRFGDEAEETARRATRQMERNRGAAARLERQIRMLTEAQREQSEQSRQQSEETRRTSEEQRRNTQENDRNTRSQDRNTRSTQQNVRGLTARRDTLISLISLAGAAGAASVSAAVAMGAFGVVAAPSILKVVMAQKDLAEGWSTLSGQQRVSALQVRALTDEYKALARSYEPETLGVFNSLISTARGLLPELGELVGDTSGHILTFTNRINDFISDRIGGEFLTWAGQKAPEALNVLGDTAITAGDTALDLVQDLEPLGIGLLQLTNGTLGALNAVAGINPMLAQFAVSALLLRAPLMGVANGARSTRDRMRGFAAANAGASRSTRLLHGFMAAGPALYVAAGAALVLFAIHVANSKTEVDRLIEGLKISHRAVGNNLDGYRSLRAELEQRYLASVRAVDEAQKRSNRTVQSSKEGTDGARQSVEQLKDEQERLRREIGATDGTIVTVERAAAMLATRYGVTAEQANRMATAAGVDLSKALDGTGKLTNKAAQKILQYAEAADLANNANKRISLSLQDAGNKALTLTDRMKALAAAFDAQFTPSIQAFQATTQLGEGFRRLAEQVGEAKGRMDGSSKASLELRNQFAQQLTTVQQLHQSTFQLTGSQDRANAAVSRYLPILYALAGGNREARAQVDRLAQVTGFNINTTNISRQAFINQTRALFGAKVNADALWRAYQRLTGVTNAGTTATAAYITRVRDAAGQARIQALRTDGAAGAQRVYNERVRAALPVLYALAGNNKRARGEVDALARSTGAATGATDVSRRAFLNAANAMGVARAKAEALWKEIRKIRSRKADIRVSATGMFTRDPGRFIPGLATGGPVPSIGPESTRAYDSVPAMLRVDEHVWTPEEVDAVGGHGAMLRMRALARRGQLQGFARGGPVNFAGSGSVRGDVNTVMRPVFGGIDGMVSTISKALAEAWKKYASGGRALAWARTQVGKPYLWGGVGPAGYDCCIIGTVRVYGPDGAKSIQDVRAGDRVFSHVDGRLEVHTVTAAWQSKYQPVFKVRTRNRAVTASANHPFLRVVSVDDRTTHQEEANWPGPVKTSYGGRKHAVCTLSTCDRNVLARGMCNMHYSRWRKHGDPRVYMTTGLRYEVQWARLDELKRGDLLVQPRLMATDAKPNPELPDGTPVDIDVAWLLGAMVGDGTVTDKGVRLCMYGEDRDRATRIISDRWGCHPSHGESYGLVASCVQLSRALAALGMRRLGPEKRIPEVVWTWDAELQRAFLDGYCDADGHRPADQKRHGERTYHSASEELIEDVRALHIILGDAVSNITVTKRTKPITIKGKLIKHARPQYGFAVWTGMKTGESALRVSPGMAEWLDAGDFTVSAVRDISYEGEQDTWDLEVEEAHNFIADGVVVHNSGWTSALTNIIQGRSPHQRRHTTHDFGASGGPDGFVRNRHSAFQVGVTDAGVGHMAGTLSGVAVESSGGAGVRVGGGARGANHPMFTRQYGLRMAQGGAVSDAEARLARRALRPGASRREVDLAATLGLTGDPSSSVSPVRPRVPAFGAGGWVTGKPGKDRNLIAATRGEFVVAEDQAARYPGLVEALNAGRVGQALIAPTIGAGAMRAVGGDGASAGRPRDVHIHVHNHGAIGSRLEIERWLAKSIDSLDQQGRVPWRTR